jgi:hypothetical protein
MRLTIRAGAMAGFHQWPVSRNSQSDEWWEYFTL